MIATVKYQVATYSGKVKVIFKLLNGNCLNGNLQIILSLSQMCTVGQNRSWTVVPELHLPNNLFN